MAEQSLSQDEQSTKKISWQVLNVKLQFYTVSSYYTVNSAFVSSEMKAILHSSVYSV